MTDSHALVRNDEYEDTGTNDSRNPLFEDIVQARLSRRQVLSGTAGAVAIAALGGGRIGSAMAYDVNYSGPLFPNRLPQLGFTPVPKGLEDTVTIPRRYNYDVLYALGDPIAKDVSDYRNDGTDEAASFAHRAGDHHDAIQYFGLGPNGQFSPHSSDRGLLCMNHEAITPVYLHLTGPTTVGGVRTVPDEVLKEFYAHGVSVIEIVKERHRKRGATTQWDYKQHSRFNRRIHTLTEIKLSGPAARTPFMVTKFSPDGSKTRGTINNCAHGTTPWGTYLTCEENWAGYFRRIVTSDNSNRTPKEITSFSRYGIAGNGRELWATVTPDTDDNLYGRWSRT